jgi:hypothetical protein
MARANMLANIFKMDFESRSKSKITTVRMFTAITAIQIKVPHNRVPKTLFFSTCDDSSFMVILSNGIAVQQPGQAKLVAQVCLQRLVRLLDIEFGRNQ